MPINMERVFRINNYAQIKNEIDAINKHQNLVESICNLERRIELLSDDSNKMLNEANVSINFECRSAYLDRVQENHKQARSLIGRLVNLKSDVKDLSREVKLSNSIRKFNEASIERLKKEPASIDSMELGTLVIYNEYRKYGS